MPNIFEPVFLPFLQNSMALWQYLKRDMTFTQEDKLFFNGAFVGEYIATITFIYGDKRTPLHSSKAPKWWVILEEIGSYGLVQPLTPHQFR